MLPVWGQLEHDGGGAGAVRTAAADEMGGDQADAAAACDNQQQDCRDEEDRTPTAIEWLWGIYREMVSLFRAGFSVG